MSRELVDESYYVSHGGKIPVKWTAPEVCTAFNSETSRSILKSCIVFNVCTGSTLQEVLHCQWCMELWSCDVWDMEHWTQTIWGIFEQPGTPLAKLCIYIYVCFYLSTYPFPKVMKLVKRGYRLPPPPGCPKAMYELMINCWSVSRVYSRYSYIYTRKGMSQSVLSLYVYMCLCIQYHIYASYYRQIALTPPLY